MSRMTSSTTIALGAGLAIVALTGACTPDGRFGWLRPGSTTATPAGAAGSPAQPGPTASLSASPEVAALQRDVQDFVNRFPKSDFRMKVAGPSTPAAVDPSKTRDGAGSAAAADANAAGEKNESESVAPSGAVVRITTPDKHPAANGASDVAASDGAAETTEAQSSPAAPVLSNGGGAVSPRPHSPTLAAPVVAAIEVTPIEPVRNETPSATPSGPNRAVAVEATTPSDSTAAIAELERTVAERPTDLDALFRLRMLYLAEGMDDRAAAPVEGLSADSAALLQAMTQTLIAVRDAARDPLNRSDSAVAAARDLMQRLRRQSPLSIDKVALVSRVNSFADYDEITPARFRAGQPARAIVYTEIANFRSETTDDGRYRTLLAETVQVFGPGGHEVLKQSHEKIADLSRRHRTDFFLASELALPESLPAGEYTLRVTIEDKLSATADQKQMPFTLVADAN